MGAMGVCKTTGDSAARVAYRLTAPLSLGASAMGELRANATLFRVKHVQIPGASVCQPQGWLLLPGLAGVVEPCRVVGDSGLSGLSGFLLDVA